MAGCGELQTRIPGDETNDTQPGSMSSDASECPGLRTIRGEGKYIGDLL